jgi:putative nucleotidyltransferase with HDIG domain
MYRLLEPDVTFGPDGSKIIPIDLDNELELDKEELQETEPIDDPEERLKHASALKSEAVKDLTRVFRKIEATGEVDVVQAGGTVGKLIDELKGNHSALMTLAQLKDADAYTFTHSVNVSILTMYLALKCNLGSYLTEIGTGALLHDIGKIKIPLKVLRKDGPLDDDERRIIEQHPDLGARLLIKSGCKSDITISCVLDHHEKLTGRGYPVGKLGAAINTFAKITCLADIYDALTTDRPYRRAMSPRDALLLMMHKMKDDLDLQLLNIFISTMGQYVEGTADLVRSASVVTPKLDKPKPVERCTAKINHPYSKIDMHC